MLDIACGADAISRNVIALYFMNIVSSKCKQTSHTLKGQTLPTIHTNTFLQVTYYRHGD
jgi:hypothetical protein